jgi:hypothetical protein
MLVPQLTPGDLLPPSMQVMPPLEQEVSPFLHAPGLVPQAIPAVHEAQLPAPSQTMLAPQLAPGVFGVPFTHVDEPVEQDAMPL